MIHIVDQNFPNQGPWPLICPTTPYQKRVGEKNMPLKHNLIHWFNLFVLTFLQKYQYYYNIVGYNATFTFRPRCLHKFDFCPFVVKRLGHLCRWQYLVFFGQTKVRQYINNVFFPQKIIFFLWLYYYYCNILNIYTVYTPIQELNQ